MSVGRRFLLGALLGTLAVWIVWTVSYLGPLVLFAAAVTLVLCAGAFAVVEAPPRPGQCPLVATIEGEHIVCVLDEDHAGRAHVNTNGALWEPIDVPKGVAA